MPQDAKKKLPSDETKVELDWGHNQFKSVPTRSTLSKAPSFSSSISTQPKQENYDRSAFGLLKASIDVIEESPYRSWVVPALLVVSNILLMIPIVGWILRRFIYSTVGMIVHEMGHASAAWLSSKFALSLPGTTLISSSQSPLMKILVVIFIAWITLIALRNKNLVWAILGFVLAFCFYELTYKLSETENQGIISWAGAAGEILIPAFWILSYVDPLISPELQKLLRVPRFLGVVVLCLAFSYAFQDWIAISQNLSLMAPRLGTPSEPRGGDMDVLLIKLHWNSSTIYHSYIYLCVGSIFLMVLNALRKSGRVFRP